MTCPTLSDVAVTVVRQRGSHGAASNAGKTREYRAWSGAKDRCYSPRNRKYPVYGGRGITMCPEWRDNFSRFLVDMGPCPSSAHSLDREDSNGPYAKWNCRWATDTEQQRNRRNNRLIAFHGEVLCLAEWAARAGIHRRTIARRLDVLGWSLERALTTPSRGGAR